MVLELLGRIADGEYGQEENHFFTSRIKYLPHTAPFKEFIPLRYMHLYRILHMIGEAFIDGWQELDLLARNVTQYLEPDKWEEPNWWYSEEHSGYFFYENTTNGDNVLFKYKSREDAKNAWFTNKSLMQLQYLREIESLQRLHKATYLARELLYDGVIKAYIMVCKRPDEPWATKTQFDGNIIPISNYHWATEYGRQDTRFIKNINDKSEVGVDTLSVVQNEKEHVVSGITIVSREDIKELASHIAFVQSDNKPMKDKKARDNKKKLSKLAALKCNELLVKLANEQKNNANGYVVYKGKSHTSKGLFDFLKEQDEFEHLTQTAYKAARKEAVAICREWGDSGGRKIL